MSIEDDFTDALIDAYQRTGEEVGYWAHRFVRAVRRNGGLAQARKMLKPRTKGQRAGLDALLNAGRPDLTVEAIVLSDRFRGLFSDTERSTAAERLGDYAKQIDKIRQNRDRLYPDELEPGHKYIEGARKTVRVNAFERNPKARKDCLETHGTICCVCGFDFEAIYGELGKGFIHVHHLNPIALTNGEYELNAENDLRPVCPNCHAMLHRPDTLLSIEQLRSIVIENVGEIG
jgi:5-methylcytosine-specific restriction protein A